MRGDCDDLSELDQEIAELQGRNAQMIGLPAHAALVWAEPRPGGTWITYLLQTGQPLGFEAPTLPDSLELAYKSFGSGELFDRTKLEVLLRFSGENTRSSWYLSWRIFADPGYARTMIDVQRDWHFQTYQRAIVKMQELVASGDEDPANYTELAGLYHYTGQYALGADALAIAIAKSEPGETRLSMQIDRVVALASAGQCDGARALARELRERGDPGARGEDATRGWTRRGSRWPTPLMVERCDPRARARDPGARRDAAGRRAGDGARRRRSRSRSSTWRPGAWQTDPMRDRLRWYVASSVAVLLGDPRGRARALARPRGDHGGVVALARRARLPRARPRRQRAVALRGDRPAARSELGRSEPGARADRGRAAAAGEPAARSRAARRRARRSASATSSSCASRRPSGRASSRRCSRRRTRRSTPRAWPTSRSAPSARTREARALGLDHRSFEHELRELRLVSGARARATSARCARSCARSSSRTTGACA